MFKGRNAAATILITALVIRIIIAVVVDHQTAQAGRQFLVEGDANGYWELAERIRSGAAYELYDPPRRILRTPGFPLLLAGAMSIVGSSVFRVSLVLAVVCSVCCWLTLQLGREISGSRCGLLAAGLAAFSPLQSGIGVQVLSEGWFSVWLVAAVLAVVRLQKRLRRSDVKLSAREILIPGLLTGLVIGSGVLVRPGWILFAPLTVLILFVGKRERRSVWACGAAVLLGTWLVLLPWAWRNHGVCGHWVYTSLWSGASLYDGLNPEASGGSNMEFFEQDALMRRMSEYEADRYYRAAAVRYAVENPGRTLQLACLKAGRFLSLSLNDVTFSSPWIVWICRCWYLVLLSFGVIGLRYSGIGLPHLATLVAPFFLFLLVHLVFVGSVRYRLPVEFPLYVIAAAGIEVVLEHFVLTKDRSRGTGQAG